MTQVTDGPPELFSIRNALYLGNYSTVVSKASQAITSADIKPQRDVLLYRAQIALGEYDQVVSQIQDNDSTSIALRAVRYFASYMKAFKLGDLSGVRSSISKLEQLMEDPVQAQDATLLTLAATIYLQEGNETEALKIVHNPSSLELASLQVRGLIRINRVDLAEIALRHMLDMNDDATISQLTNAYLAIAQGGQEKIEEAQIIFQELQKKFGGSSVILNGLAICALHLGAYENAEKVLLTSLGTVPNDPDTLINLIVCGQHLKKGEEYTAKYLTQLSSAAPNHPWVKKYNELDSDFDSASLAYST